MVLLANDFRWHGSPPSLDASFPVRGAAVRGIRANTDSVSGRKLLDRLIEACARQKSVHDRRETEEQKSIHRGEVTRNARTVAAVSRCMKNTLAVAALLSLTVSCGLRADAVNRQIPSPLIDTPAAEAAGPQVAVLAGGCFWGLQGM